MELQGGSLARERILHKDSVHSNIVKVRHTTPHNVNKLDSTL